MAKWEDQQRTPKLATKEVDAEEIRRRVEVIGGVKLTGQARELTNALPGVIQEIVAEQIGKPTAMVMTNEQVDELERREKARARTELRDQFAAAVLTGLLGLRKPASVVDDKKLAKEVYKIADAMLAEREKGGKG